MLLLIQSLRISRASSVLFGDMHTHVGKHVDQHGSNKLREAVISRGVGVGMPSGRAEHRGNFNYLQARWRAHKCSLCNFLNFTLKTTMFHKKRVDEIQGLVYFYFGWSKIYSAFTCS